MGIGVNFFRTEPDYYIAITNPIDMVAIQQKVKSGEYEDVDQMTADVELLVSNAKTYYAVKIVSTLLFVLFFSVFITKNILIPRYCRACMKKWKHSIRIPWQPF